MTKEIGLNEITNLNERGFVHLENVVITKDVMHVRELLDNLFDQARDETDENYRKYVVSEERTSGHIYEINHCSKLDSKLRNSALFKRCQEIASILIRRKAFRSFDHAIFKTGNSGSVLWHQDQAYKQTVKKMQSIVLWIPLHNVSMEEGCMQYIPLNAISKLLPHSKHYESGTLFTDISDSIPRQVCEAKIGDLIVHTPLTVHSSLPNRSSHVRKAWSLHFGPYGRFEPFLPANLLHLANYFFGNDTATVQSSP